MSHAAFDKDSVALAGSPFRVSVAPAETDVPSCVRLFEDRDAGAYEPLAVTAAGQMASFEFIARDCYFNSRGVGGDRFQVLPHGPESLAGEAVDKGDGTYEVVPWLGLASCA